MSTISQTDVAGFAAIINSRLAAESRIARAVAFGWCCGGVASFLALTGLGVAATFWGYSYVHSVKPAAERTANALVEALQRTEIKTTISGTMSLAPNFQLRLAPGQTVRLEEGAIVALDQQSTVRIVDMRIDTPQPSKQQLQVGATSKSDELPFTNYTIFKHVNVGKSSIVTGWDYDLSDTLRPRSQFCYYTEKSEKSGPAVKYMIALNGAPYRASPLAKSADFDGTVANCIWFSGA
jgi:hypothetical protein